MRLLWFSVRIVSAMAVRSWPRLEGPPPRDDSTASSKSFQAQILQIKERYVYYEVTYIKAAAHPARFTPNWLDHWCTIGVATSQGTQDWCGSLQGSHPIGLIIGVQ